MGALCVSSIALRPRTIWNAAGIGTPAGQLEPSGTPGTVLPSKGSQRGLEQPAGLLEQPAGLLERAQHHWNCAKRIIFLVLNATISPLWGVGGGIGVLKNFNFWGERKPKSPQLLQSSRSCDLSAERVVDAGNR